MERSVEVRTQLSVEYLLLASEVLIYHTTICQSAFAGRNKIKRVLWDVNL